MVTLSTQFAPRPRSAERYDFMHDVPGFVRGAIGACALADSYRRVCVGAVIVAERQQTGAIAAFVSANSKPIAQSVKCCAEMHGLANARAAGFSVVRGIVVAGPSDPNIISGITPIPTSTLHPCIDCLTRMSLYEREGQLRVPDATPVVTVGQENGRYQMHTVGEMQALHGLRVGLPLDADVLYDGSFRLWPAALEAAQTLPGHPVAAVRSGLELVGAPAVYTAYAA